MALIATHEGGGKYLLRIFWGKMSKHAEYVRVWAAQKVNYKTLTFQIKFECSAIEKEGYFYFWCSNKIFKLHAVSAAPPFRFSLMVEIIIRPCVQFTMKVFLGVNFYYGWLPSQGQNQGHKEEKQPYKGIHVNIEVSGRGVSTDSLLPKRGKNWAAASNFIAPKNV